MTQNNIDIEEVYCAELGNFCDLSTNCVDCPFRSDYIEGEGD